MGRWQILGENPKIICDTAHNSEGLIPVLRQLKNIKYDRLHIVLGVVDDKNLDIILPLFPRKASYYFCKPDVPRGLTASLLSENGARFELQGSIFDSVRMAYKTALKNASKHDVIYVGGSTFVVAEVL